MADSFTYVVLLEVRVEGPDAEWDDVAASVAKRVAGLAVKGGFRILEAAVDESKDPEEEMVNL